MGSALYAMEYQGNIGLGGGCLYNGNGKILGTDIHLSRYKGDYVERGGRLIGKGTLTATRTSSSLVTGVTLDLGKSLPISMDWPVDFADGSIHSAEVGGRPVQVVLTKIGDID